LGGVINNALAMFSGVSGIGFGIALTSGRPRYFLDLRIVLICLPVNGMFNLAFDLRSGHYQAHPVINVGSSVQAMCHWRPSE
jgi:hypothetical protein